jgi:hypothetical protein
MSKICCQIAVKVRNATNTNRLKSLVDLLEQSRCDFTHFSAAPAPIILPRETPFKHESENEKEEILWPLPPYRCRGFKKEA